MKNELLIRKRAEGHIRDIFEWYEKQRPGLGTEFVVSIEAVFSRIQRDPLHFQKRYKNIRCATLQRFPYGVFYFTDDDRVIVLAVFHFKRNIRQLKR
jgi:plasmid stabilization system protein ParE